MKKVYLFAALTAGLVLSSCSSDDQTVKEEPQVKTDPGAVGFDVYTQKATTRAGWTGSVSNTTIKETTDATKMGFHGFGVFGFYTDNNEYEQRSVPNFMYNQQVRWNGTNAFTYEPVVYWPNEYGDNAVSDDQDKLTFFAYAPYVKVVPSSGKIDGAANDKTLEQWGITGMTKNTSQGDPVLKYIGSFDNKKSVDLCWGVADNGDGAVWNTTQTGNPQAEIKNGMPWIDLERPAGVAQKVRFTFKHATAQMRVSIDADIDVDGRGHDKDVTKKTRIWVRQVTFKGFTMKGSLNLNNDDASTPKWLDYNGQNELVAEDVIIYDGRKDGKEGVAGAVATNEKTLGLNPALIQDGVYAKGDGTSIYDATQDVVVYGVDASGNQKSEEDWKRPGVTKTAVNLFKYNNDDNRSQKSAMAAASEFFHVIPVNDNFEVEIVYDVETVDQNLAQNLSDGAAKGSSIENRITKAITFGNAANNKLLPGHSYTLALHLGMNSVKFEASVTDWVEEAAQDVDLPLNTPVFAAGTPASVTIPYTGSYTFALTGLHGQETMSVAAGVNTINKGGSTGNQEQTAGFISSPSAWTATKNNAWTNGTALQTLGAKTNPNTTNQIQKVTWTGNQSGIPTEMTFTQTAHPLYMTIKSAVAGTKQIVLERHNNAGLSETTDWQKEYGWFCGTDGKALTATGNPEATTPENGIAVYRNGSKLNFEQKSAATLAGNEFDFTDTGVPTGSLAAAAAATATITIGDALQPGDVIKVVLKTGDAPAETITYTCLKPYATATSTPTEASYSVAANFTGKTNPIILAGFNAGETVTATAPSKGTGGTASAAGIVEVTIDDIAANTKVTNFPTSDYVTFSGGISGKSVKFKLIQAFAQPDGEKTEVTFKPAKNFFTIVLKDAAGTELSGDEWEGASQNVTVISGKYKASGESTFTPMTEATGATPSNKLQYKAGKESSDNGIYIGSGSIAAGDTYEFVIQAGDAAQFTVTKTGLW